MRTIYRYEVPIDDQDHEIALTSDPVKVASVRTGNEWYFEFWAEHDDQVGNFTDSFRVFGTGHPIPNNYSYVGTAERVFGLVFHLYRKENI